MINKRSFLKSGATAMLACGGTPVAMASVPASLSDFAGAATWLAHVGQVFDLDGHAVTLQAVSQHATGQAGEQFSLTFGGALPPDLGERLHTLTQPGAGAMQLYLTRTGHGLRADFCRLTG